jgi:hypothetical protein
MRHLLGLSGKDSLCAALLIKAHQPDLWEELEIFVSLTGAEYPETLTWLNSLPTLLGKPLTYVVKDLHQIISDNTRNGSNEFYLPSRQVRYCTRESKIKPFEKFIGKNEATLYTGIRYDEDRVGFKESKYIRSEFPLHYFQYDIKKVWQLILSLPDQYQPPTFFWKSLYQLTSIIWKNTYPSESLDDTITYAQKVILFSGRSRPNCYFCFNQRRYEIVWLQEVYPDLFQQMKSYESDSYCWIKDFPLSELTTEKANRIKLKRAMSIIKKLRQQKFDGLDNDLFSGMVSCGLFCGK